MDYFIPNIGGPYYEFFIYFYFENSSQAIAKISTLDWSNETYHLTNNPILGDLTSMTTAFLYNSVQYICWYFFYEDYETFSKYDRYDCRTLNNIDQPNVLHYDNIFPDGLLGGNPTYCDFSLSAGYLVCSDEGGRLFKFDVNNNWECTLII